jgi:hypothetical protein
MVAAVQKYIRSLRSPAKKAFAQAFWTWVLNGRDVDTRPDAPDFGLSYMASQAVWFNINRICAGVLDENHST